MFLGGEAEGTRKGTQYLLVQEHPYGFGFVSESRWQAIAGSNKPATEPARKLDPASWDEDRKLLGSLRFK